MKRQDLALNDDILFLITEYLEPRDMSSFLLVCKEWNNQLTNNKELKSKLLRKQLLNKFINKELNNYQFIIDQYFPRGKNCSLKRMFKSVVKQVKYEKQQTDRYENYFIDLKEFIFIYWNKLFNILFSYLKDYDKNYNICFVTNSLQKPCDDDNEDCKFIIKFNSETKQKEVFNAINLLLNKFLKLSKCLLNTDIVKEINRYNTLDDRFEKLYNLFFEYISNNGDKSKNIEYFLNNFKPKYNNAMLEKYLQNKLYSFDTFCNFMKNVHNYSFSIFYLLITQPNLTFTELKKLINKYFYSTFVVSDYFIEKALQHVLTTKEGNLKTKKETALYLMSFNKKPLNNAIHILQNELDNPIKNDFDILDSYCKIVLNSDVEKIEKLYLLLTGSQKRVKGKIENKEYLLQYFKDNYCFIKQKYFN